MLRGNYNERYEEDSLRISASVINEVKSKLSLDEYLRSQSALSSSFSEINNGYNGQVNNVNGSFSGDMSNPFISSNMNDNNNSNGYANQNQRVLVRKMDNPGVNRYVNNNPVNQYNNDYQQVNNGYGYSSDFDTQRNNPFNSGISHVFILIFAIVLIALVIMVSLFIMRSIGM